MELKIYSPTEDGFIQKIEWNFEELKTEIAEKVEHYKSLVYTEDQMKTAKSDRANLRKFVDALESKRKEIKKQCLAPYEEFEKQMKALVSIVNEPITLIDNQVKSYEEEKKQEKFEEIIKIWNDSNAPEWLNINQVFDEKWLNASVTLKKVSEELEAKLETIKNNLVTLSNLPEFSFEATEVYKQSLDINKAINEGQRLLEMQKRKAEYEAAAIKPAEPAEELPQCPAPETNKTWISFKAFLTVEDATALRDFFKSRNIEFTRI